MVKAKLAIVSIFATSMAIYAANVTACVGCHGANFEKKALGASKIVKDMSKEEIINALKGYKAGSYGGKMKSTMESQVKALSDKDIEDIANLIKSAKAVNKPKKSAKGLKELDNEHGLIKVPDIKKGVADKELSYRQTDLFKEEQTTPPEVKFDAPAPGEAPRIARSYVNAPPLIPHSVEGLLPITKNNNACLGCHMPNVAKSSGATAIPKSHFMDFRPKAVFKNGKVIKDGKELGVELKNTSDIKIAKFKHLKDLNPARFNCSQCHVPQANTKPLVKNMFKPDFKNKELKQKSNLIDVINEGVK